MKGKVVFGQNGKRDRFYLDGVEVSRRVFKRYFPDRESPGAVMLNRAKGWPLNSEALSVHPDQAKEAEADATKKGVPTHFDATGTPEFTTRAHRKEYLRRYGFHDNDGGYGD